MPEIQIFILDLMHGDSAPVDGVEANDLAKDLDQIGLDACVYSSANRGQLYSSLDGIRRKLAETPEADKRMPFIHFFGHGQMGGIELYDEGRRELVSWQELNGLVAPVSECRDGIAVLCFDCCYGLDAFRIYRLPRARPHFFALVGPTRDVEGKKSLRAFCAFYEALFIDYAKLRKEKSLSWKEITAAFKAHFDAAVVRMNEIVGYHEPRFEWVYGFSDSFRFDQGHPDVWLERLD